MSGTWISLPLSLNVTAAAFLARSPVVRTLTVVALCSASLARADWSLRLEDAAALPVTAPQTSYYGLGISGSATAAFELVPSLELEAGLGYTFLDAADSSPLAQPGSALTLSLGLRVKRPSKGATLVPFFELLGGYVRTGPSNRPEVLAGAGLLIRLGHDVPVLAGPSVHALYIPRLANEPEFTTRDVAVLTFGLSLELEPRPARAPERLTP